MPATAGIAVELSMITKRTIQTLLLFTGFATACTPIAREYNNIHYMGDAIPSLRQRISYFCKSHYPVILPTNNINAVYVVAFPPIRYTLKPVKK